MSIFSTKLIKEFENKEDKEVLLKVGKIVLIFAVGIFVLLAIYRPKWLDSYGAIFVCDPITGMEYYIDEDDKTATIIGLTNGNSIRKGCLKIPKSIWGRTVINIDLSSRMAQRKRDNSIYNRITSIEIPDSVVTIKSLGLSNLQEVIGGDNVKCVRWNAFMNCTELRKVEFLKLEILDEYSFSGCTNLKEVKLGNYLKFINEGVFWGCTSLEYVELGYNISTICSDAFYECKNLKQIGITDNLQDIRERAFLNSGIEKIDLPNIMKIEKDAFQGTPWSNSEEGKRIIKEYEQ